MTVIRVQLEELEAVAKHVPDAEDACCRARTSLSWELPSLVMEIPGIGSDAIHELKDELVHGLHRYKEKLNEAEGLQNIIFISPCFFKFFATFPSLIPKTAGYTFNFPWFEKSHKLVHPGQKFRFF
jgi:hypothetical protein